MLELMEHLGKVVNILFFFLNLPKYSYFAPSIRFFINFLIFFFFFFVSGRLSSTLACSDFSYIGSCEPLVTTQHFHQLSVQNLVLCGVLNPEPTDTTWSLMPKQSWSNTCIFSTRHISVFSHLGTLDSIAALCLRAILKQWDHQPKRKKRRQMWH